jgi:hypothetical protein
MTCNLAWQQQQQTVEAEVGMRLLAACLPEWMQTQLAQHVRRLISGSFVITGGGQTVRQTVRACSRACMCVTET